MILILQRHSQAQNSEGVNETLEQFGVKVSDTVESANSKFSLMQMKYILFVEENSASADDIKNEQNNSNKSA